MIDSPQPLKQPRILPDDTDWRLLTRDPHKPATYNGDGQFRQSWSDWKNLAAGTSSAIYRYTSLLLKPETFAARKTGLILDRVRKLGFRATYAKEVQFDDKSIQAAWRYQMDKSSDDRFRLRGCFWGDTTSVYIVLRGPPADECAADRLARLKGSAHPEKQIPGTLRHGLGGPNAMFSFLHTPDDTADFIRELSVWLTYGERYDLIRAINAAKLESEESVLAAIARLESSRPVVSLDTRKALADLIASVRGAEAADPDACRQMLGII
jgi:nucleoside diphosphate kinase